MATIHAQAIWVSEHYWPGVADELVFAQAQRLAGVDGCLSAVVLTGQETVMGLFTAEAAADVEARLAAIGLRSETVRPGWALDPSRADHLPTLETS